jgi:hypothetical protein
MRTVLDADTGRNRDLQTAVDGLELELRASREPELIPETLGYDKTSGSIDGSSHGISLPSICHRGHLNQRTDETGFPVAGTTCRDDRCRSRMP